MTNPLSVQYRLSFYVILDPSIIQYEYTKSNNTIWNNTIIVWWLILQWYIILIDHVKDIVLHRYEAGNTLKYNNKLQCWHFGLLYKHGLLRSRFQLVVHFKLESLFLQFQYFAHYTNSFSSGSFLPFTTLFIALQYLRKEFQ